MHITEAEIMALIAAFIWPLMRIGAMFVVLPVFSIRSIPARLRLLLAVMITLVIMPLLPPMPDVAMLSYPGVMVALQQVAIGLISGFVVQMVFAAVVFAGQGIAYSMGLGFASMVDPQSGLQVPVVSQIYIVAISLMFLSMNGHLLIIEMLVDSFRTLPVAVDGLQQSDLWSVILWGSRIFAGGVLLALPVIASLLLINISFGVATKAAPQLNIFSVGFPVSLLLGLLLIWLTLPNISNQFSDILTDAYKLIGVLLRIS